MSFVFLHITKMLVDRPIGTLVSDLSHFGLGDAD